MKKIISLVLCLAMAVCMASVCVSAEDNTLSFKNGEFKILILSDPQDDANPAYDMQNIIRMSIEQTQPDLIVLTGDIVEDSRAGDPGVDANGFFEGVNDSNFDKQLENIFTATAGVVGVVNEYGIPFAIAQGNNDHKVDIDDDKWLEIYGAYENSLCARDALCPDFNDGHMDYYLEIAGSNGAPAFGLWMLDTGLHGLDDNQLGWFNAKTAELENAGKSVPSIVFQHIHTADVGNLFEECKIFDEGARLVDGKCYRLNAEIASGHANLGYVPCEPTAEFSAWKANGNVLGAYFGHQHQDGFTGTVDGIELGFNYGIEFAKKGPYGIRVITLHEDDIENFDNVIYTYEGTVKRNTARLELQEDKGYEVPENLIARIFYYIKNFFVCLFGI